MTPTQDPYTMSAMAIPLYVFYELVVLILRIRERRGPVDSLERWP